MNFFEALPPHKLAFPPFALTIIFLNPKASPASFTKQGKWKNRVSHSQGKGLHSVHHPLLRWCHPVLGPGVLGGNLVFKPRMRNAMVSPIWLTAGSRGKTAEVLELLLPCTSSSEPDPAGRLQRTQERARRRTRYTWLIFNRSHRENYSPGVG